MDDQQQRLRSFLGGVIDADPGDDTLESAARPSLGADAQRLGVPGDVQSRIESADAKLRRGQALDRAEQFALEAIILPDKRPVIDVNEDRFEAPTHPMWQFLGEAAYQERLTPLLPAVGRIDIVGDPTVPYLGTGFMVSPTVLLTNRHVADDFIRGIGKQVHFDAGLGGRIEYAQWVEPSERDQLVLTIERPLMIHPWWDAALLEVSGYPSDRAVLSLRAEPHPHPQRLVVVTVGYPAFDWRLTAPADVQNEVFRSRFNVKRLQPGRVMEGASAVESFHNEVQALTHDCSTLGGNSGSAVIDVETGQVVALHFAGRYLDRNYAVPAWELLKDPHVQALGVRHDGTPGSASSAVWMGLWSSLETPAAAPATAAAGATASTVSDGAWFEAASDSALASELKAKPEVVAQRLRRVLGDAEANELISDLSSELNAAETDLEGLFSRKPNPDYPEIILLHGIMGGHLAHQGFFRNRLWLDAKELVKGNIADRLRLEADGVTAPRDLRIVPDGHIKLAYGKPARKWRRQGFVVHPFAYDWRKGVHHAAFDLHVFIEQRSLANGRRPLVLVAHSMGGLVASLYSQRFPEWSQRVEQAIFMGSPLGGSYAVPKAVLGYNEFLARLAALARADNAAEWRAMAATMPGLIDMLPNPTLFPDADDFYQQSGWPVHPKPAQRWLTQSRNLKAQLRSAPLLERTTLMVSLKHGTTTTMPWADDGSTRRVGPATAPGDGTVPASSALVDGVPAFLLDLEHGSLPKDPKAIRGVVAQITEGHPGIEPVTDSALAAPPTASADAESAGALLDEAALQGRRDRFATGDLTAEDLRWLGDF